MELMAESHSFFPTTDRAYEQATPSLGMVQNTNHLPET